MEIKQLDQTYIDDVHAITSRIFMRDFPEYGPGVSEAYVALYFTKDYFKELFKSRLNCLMGAFENDKLVGFVCAKGDLGGVLFVDLLFIDELFRNKGVGIALIKQIESWALTNFFHYIWLFTESKKNIEYYKKRGFYYIGMHKKSWYGEDEHILGKVLRDRPFDEIFKKG